MNQNTSGAVLLLIIAAAGLYTNHPLAWVLAAATAALAFLANELRDAANLFGVSRLSVAAEVVAIASWITIAAASLSLWF